MRQIESVSWENIRLCVSACVGVQKTVSRQFAVVCVRVLVRFV